MEKVTGIKSVDFKIKALGRGERHRLPLARAQGPACAQDRAAVEIPVVRG